MRYRDPIIDVPKGLLKQWKLAIEHGDKKRIVEYTELSYGTIYNIFKTGKATGKQIEAIIYFFANEKK